MILVLLCILIDFSISQSSVLTSVFEKGTVLCQGQENDVIIVPQERCDSNWISNSNCADCKNQGGVFCLDSKSNEGYCRSKGSECIESFPESIDYNGTCPCSSIAMSGPDCTIMNCGENGIFVPKDMGCKCKPGWTGDRCDSCLEKTNTDRTYICCKFPKDCDDVKCDPKAPDNWVLLAPRDDKLFRFLSGSFTPSSCVLPGSALQDGTTLSCDCSISNIQRDVDYFDPNVSDVEFLSKNLDQVIEYSPIFDYPERMANGIADAVDNTVVSNQAQAQDQTQVKAQSQVKARTQTQNHERKITKTKSRSAVTRTEDDGDSTDTDSTGTILFAVIGSVAGFLIIVALLVGIFYFSNVYLRRKVPVEEMEMEASIGRSSNNKSLRKHHSGTNNRVISLK